jgi:hypothetical protein
MGLIRSVPFLYAGALRFSLPGMLALKAALNHKWERLREKLVDPQVSWLCHWMVRRKCAGQPFSLSHLSHLSLLFLW